MPRFAKRRLIAIGVAAARDRCSRSDRQSLVERRHGPQGVSALPLPAHIRHGRRRRLGDRRLNRPRPSQRGQVPATGSAQ